MQERLQKYLARCGVGSRRYCEEVMAAGKVQVDGQVVTRMGSKVDPETQSVTVDGETVRSAPLRHFALHKPKGVVCTHSDPAGRPRAVDLVPSRGLRLFPIGRLDEDSEGLLLLTNDGALAQRIAHPSFEVPKVYRVSVKGEVQPAALERLRKGVHLAEGRTAPARVQVVRKTRLVTTLLITIREGKNRHIRRILAKVELPVKRLLRVRVGPVLLGSLKRGEWRRLAPEEVSALREGHNALPKRRAKRQPRSRVGETKTRSKVGKAKARGKATGSS